MADNTQMTQATTQAVKKESTLAENILKRIEEFQMSGSIDIPENYSPANALRSAWLILQDTVNKDKLPVLTTCTKESIANALLKMVVLGLNPAKKQCYFIPYGKNLSCDSSYFGEMATAKRVHGNIPDDGFSYSVVYQGDDFEYERKRGKVRVIKHGQKLENVNKANVLAAYCEIYDGNDKLINSELMTFDEIKQAWRQSKMSPVSENGNVGQGGTHGKFTADMCLKTAIRKACKPIINSSDDKNLRLLKKIIPSRAAIEAQAEIDERANQGPPIGFTTAEIVPDGVDKEAGEVKELAPAEAENLDNIYG